MDEVDHLHLVELVDAEHAARHLAGAAGFAAEAGRVGGELDGRLWGDLRELHAVEDVVAVEVGDGHLGGGDQPEVVGVRVVEVLGELRELAGAGHGRGVDHEGREHLGVALLLAVDVEHVLDERALELGALSEDDGEAGAGELHAAREVEDA